MIVYFNGRFMPKEEVKISPDDRGFLFADGTYEVIRSYNGKLFRMEEHLIRISRSLEQIRISGVNVGSLESIADRLIKENRLEDKDASVYIQVTRGVEGIRSHAFSAENMSPTVYAYAHGFQIPAEKWAKGVKAVIMPDIRWSRCDIKGLGLQANVLANQQAKESGAEEAIFVRNGVVTEGSHTNFCAVLNGELLTHPDGNYILPGITRTVVLSLCKKLNIPHREYPIFESQLNDAEECMILGTTTEIMPVVQINDRKVGTGKPGPVALKLQKAFQEVVGN